MPRPGARLGVTLDGWMGTAAARHRVPGTRGWQRPYGLQVLRRCAPGSWVASLEARLGPVTALLETRSGTAKPMLGKRYLHVARRPFAQLERLLRNSLPAPAPFSGAWGWVSSFVDDSEDCRCP